MKNIKIVSNWLTNPKRNFSEGLVLFETFASETIKKKYLTFLKENASDEQFSPAMSILTNKLSAVKQQMVLFPDKFKQEVIQTIKEDDKTDELLEQKEEQIAELKEETAELKEQLDESQWDTDERLLELEEEIEKLKDDIRDIQAKKLTRIVPFASLPEKLQKLYKRNQEITPKMASYHAEIADEKLSAQQRAYRVRKLVELDNERRANWDVLNSYSEGTFEEDMLKEKKVMEYSKDELIAGSQMEKRVATLKQNITNCEKTIAETNREVIRQNAEKRLSAYKEELAELQSKLTADDEK